MGVHCYLTELGTVVTMAAKILAVVASLASLAAAEPGYGVAYHPYGGSSSVYRSTQGLTGYGHGYHGYGYGHGYHGYGYGKRDAEAGYGYGHGYGAASVYVSQADHGYGYNPAHYTYGYNIGHGYGKRSADAEPGFYGKRSAEPGYYGGASSYVHQSRPYYHGSYGYGINHYGKRSADAGYLTYGHGYGYGHAGSFQQVNRPYSAYGVSVAHPY